MSYVNLLLEGNPLMFDKYHKYSSAWVPFDTVYPYIGNKEKFLLTNRIPRGFREAIEAIEDAVKSMPQEVCKRRK